MSPSTEADYRRAIINAFGDNPNKYRKVIKVLEKMIPDMEEYWAEMDAEYEMGRRPCPPGYDKRKRI